MIWTNQLLFVIQVFLIGLALKLALRRGVVALTSLVILLGVLANLFVLKQVSFWSWNATPSDAYAVGGILGLNLLQECFGKEAARSAVRTGLGALGFVALMSQLHLLFAPSSSDWAQGAYTVILSPSPRILAASLATFWIVQQIDVWVFAKLRAGGGAFPFRMALSGALSQALDTALFSVLGLYGLVDSLVDIAAISFLVKCAALALAVPMVGWVRRAV